MSTHEADGNRMARLEMLLKRVRDNAALLAQQRLAGRVSRPASDPSPGPQLDAELHSIPPSSAADELPSVDRTNTDWLGATAAAAQEPEALRQADSHRTLAETPAAKGGESSRVPAGDAEVEDLALPDLEMDSERALSDVPPPAIGATVALDEGAEIPLELEEPRDSLAAAPIAPTSSVPPDEEGLEVELPRTSYTGFDSSLSAPPSARADLAAHDRGGRERFSSVPVSEEQPAARHDLDLPPVLSQPPAVAPSVPGPTRQTQIAGTSAAAATAASFSLEQQPSAAAQPVVFEGAPTRAEAPTFLELLDRSLRLRVRR